MTPETAVVQALNGISFGALLFILAAGLSLIFGMMDVVNLAHGAFAMLGGYACVMLMTRAGVVSNPPSAAAVVTDEFVDPANDFDHAAFKIYAQSLP